MGGRSRQVPQGRDQAALKPHARDSLRKRAVDARARIALGLLIAFVSPAFAYTQNKPLEAALARNDSAALALLPAKGYRNGAAGFFAAHELHVVRGTERAWCTPQAHGVLAAGCYVEFFFQGKGLRSRLGNGDPCGCIGRWFKPPGERSYKPTEGAYYAQAVADDRAEIIEHAIYEEPRPGCR